MSSLTVQLPPGGVKEQLVTIYKLIREAQTLDENGDEMVSVVASSLEAVQLMKQCS